MTSRRLISLFALAAAALSAGCNGIDMPPPVLGFGPRPATLLGEFETDEDLARWKASSLWGRRAEGTLSLSGDHVTSGERCLAVNVPAGRSVSVSLSEVPADWGPYESLVFDIFTPKIGEVEEWVPFSLFIENTQSADWFTRVHHDSRLGVVTGRHSTIEVPLREIQVYNLKRERYGVAEFTGGFGGVEAPMGMLSRRFDITTIASLALRFTGVGADRVFYIDGVRLIKSPNFDESLATTPATVRVGSPYRFFCFDLNKGGALCDLLGDRLGLEFRYTSDRHRWHSSSSGTNHARIKIIEPKTPEHIKLRVTGSFFGPWPRPHVDLGSEASFDYTVEQARGERFPTVRIDAAFKRTGATIEGVRSLELVWRCGQAPKVAGVEMKPGESTFGKAFIAGSAAALGGKRWLALVSEKGVQARYVPTFNGAHELRIPIRLGADGKIEQGADYKVTLSLRSVL